MNLLRKALVIATLLTAVIAVSAEAAEAHGIHKTPIDDGFNIRMIDNAIYNNSQSMNASQIQSFLESKEPGVCAGPCLKNYIVPETGEQFSVFLDRVSKVFAMNPQVILSTIQKEQSLITSTNATASQINHAMGYGCPEGPGCNNALAGIYNQIFYGTRYLRAGQMYSCGDRTSLPGYSFSTRWAYGNTTDVDGKPTGIATCATGALYPYTPHRPDSAWLTATNGNHYYGNYNFIANFQAWFGPTRGTPYSAQFAGQSAAPTVGPGGQAVVWFRFKNTGTTTWSKSTVRLGTDRPENRDSGFGRLGSGLSPGWLSLKRVQLDQDSVAPGDTGSFTFTVTGNPDPGTYAEYFRPVAEGITWFEDYGVHLPMTVQAPTYGSSVAEQAGPPEIEPTKPSLIRIRLRNTGNATWQREGAAPVRLGTQGPQDRASQLYTSGSWASNSRIPLQESSVPPGQVGTFLFQVTAPRTGVYNEQFQLVAEGLQWFGTTLNLPFNAVGTFSAQFDGQSEYPSAAPKMNATAWIQFRNTGTATWKKTGSMPVRLGTDNPRDRNSVVSSGWLSPSRIQLDQDEVAPGDVGRFTFEVTPPNTGTYREYFRPVAEGRTWFGNPNEASQDITGLRYSAQFAGQSLPLTLTSGQSQPAWIQFKNTGTATWKKGGSTPIRLGTDRPRDRFSPLAFNWLSPSRIELDENEVAPGDIGRFSFTLHGAVPGNYKEYFRPVAEALYWLEDYGVHIPLNVTGS